MRKGKQIHTHGKFMTEMTVGKLKKLLKKAKTKAAANRILACIKRKKGMPIPAIAVLLEVPYTTVYRWLLQAAQDGASSFDRKKNSGAKCRLTDEQCTELYGIIEEGAVKHGYSGDAWTARRVAAVVSKKFKIEYGARGMQLLLHRIGFASKAPRPRHPKAANEEEQARFKRSVAAIRGHHKDWAVCMIDSASLIAGWNTQRGWYPVGSTRFAPTTLSRKRAHIIGALYDGELDAVFCDKVDSAEFEAFLRRQMDRKKKLIAILDNASAHHAGNIQALEEEFKGRLILVYLPPYTPELNSIELQWRVIRKAIANAVFDSVASLKRAVRKALMSNDALIVEIASYAKDKKSPPPRRCIARIGNMVSINPYYF